MNSPRLASILFLVLFGLVAPLRAEEPAVAASPAAPQAVPRLASSSTVVAAEDYCPSFDCPVYFDVGCTCEWIVCPDGWIVCGVWDGSALTRAVSPPSPLPFQL